MTMIANALSTYFASACEVNDLIVRVAGSDDDDNSGLRQELDEARGRRAEALNCLRDAAPQRTAS